MIYILLITIFSILNLQKLFPESKNYGSKEWNFNFLQIICYFPNLKAIK